MDVVPSTESVVVGSPAAPSELPRSPVEVSPKPSLDVPTGDLLVSAVLTEESTVGSSLELELPKPVPPLEPRKSLPPPKLGLREPETPPNPVPNCLLFNA